MSNELIMAELKGDLVAREKLREDLPAWRDELISLIEDIDTQLALRAMDVEDEPDAGRAAAYADYRDWKKGALYVKTKAHARLRDVKRKIATRANDLTVKRRMEFVDRLLELTDGGYPLPLEVLELVEEYLEDSPNVDPAA